MGAIKPRISVTALFGAGALALLPYANWGLTQTVMSAPHGFESYLQEMGSNYVSKRPYAALVIGTIQPGQRLLLGFGSVGPPKPAPDGNTVFEIGSVTKVFTGVTLARMICSGAIKLSEPISRYLPSGVAAPERNGAVITVEQLATHTSGLPRLPGNFDLTVTNKQNPYVNYRAADLYQVLATVELRSEPGKRSVYSNLGYGLLGHLLALKAGTNYEALVKTTICAPLDMNDTSIKLTAEQRARLAPGHNTKGELVPNWDFDVLAGCGAFRSTANDLLKFVAANLQPAGELREPLLKAQQIHFKQPGGGIGLGWQIRLGEQGRVLWHNGGTGGYASFVGFDQARGVGVVLLASSGDAFARDYSLDQIGMELLHRAAQNGRN